MLTTRALMMSTVLFGSGRHGPNYLGSIGFGAEDLWTYRRSDRRDD